MYSELHVVTFIIIGRQKWLGRLFRMQEMDPCRRLVLLKPKGIGRVGKPQLMWPEYFEENLNLMA